MADSLQVLYIAGSGRSGSTLLERMLGHVPGFVPAGELENIWQRGFDDSQLCSCGRAFLECDFWTSVANHAYGSPNEVPQQRLSSLIRERSRIRFIPQVRFPALRTASLKRDLADFRAALVPLYASVMTTSGATTVVDSSKSPSYAYLLATIPEIELYVVHLVRDSRAVCYSWQKRVRRPEVTSGVAYMGGFRPATSARRWNLRNGLAELLRFSAKRYVRVRYEDLVKDPHHALSKIVAAVGKGGVRIPNFPGPPRTVALPRIYHTASGNPIRFEHQALEVTPDIEWCTKLESRSKLTVTALTLPLLLHYGYAPRSRFPRDRSSSDH
jgi:sulfotransferase family protein